MGLSYSRTPCVGVIQPTRPACYGKPVIIRLDKPKEGGARQADRISGITEEQMRPLATRELERSPFSNSTAFPRRCQCRSRLGRSDLGVLTATRWSGPVGGARLTRGWPRAFMHGGRQAVGVQFAFRKK